MAVVRVRGAVGDHHHDVIVIFARSISSRYDLFIGYGAAWLGGNFFSQKIKFEPSFWRELVLVLAGNLHLTSHLSLSQILTSHLELTTPS